jgi:hypothetical protein
MGETISPIKEERYKQAYSCIGEGGKEGVTLAEIAKCLSIKVSPYLRNMVEEMIGYGWVQKKQAMIQTGRGLRMGWKFRVVPQQQQQQNQQGG